MLLDIRTLVVAAALAVAVCAGARILLCRLHPTMPGLVHWAWASGLGAVALCLFAAMDSIPDIYSLLLSQVLATIGFVVAWDGFRRFVGRPPLSRWALTGLAVITLVPNGIAHIVNLLELRSAVNSVLISLLCGLIARELLRAAGSGRTAMRATGWIYAINAIIFFLRSAVDVVVADHDALSQLRHEGLSATILLWWLCMVVAVTLGMVLMAGERLQRDLDQQASRDPLTGAFNRRAFTQLAEKEMARAKRSNKPLSLLMMDLDYFKQINDRLGHAGGDAMLCLFVSVIDRVLRDVDVYCRFGGEEFIALLPESSATQALAAAERLRTAYLQATTASVDPSQPQPFAFTVSIGISEIQPGEVMEDAVRRADAALYRAKAAGRNRCELAAAFVAVKPVEASAT